MKSIKYLFAIVIFVVNTSVVNAQDGNTLKVIKVFGRITKASDNQSLLRGDVVSENEELNYGSPRSKAAVISSKGGRFVLSSNAHGSGNTVFIPPISDIASRSGGIVNSLDLNKMFDSALVVTETMKLPVNNNSFPQDKDKFFYLRFNYPGEAAPINKKLPHSGDTIIFSSQSIYTIDDAPVNILPENNMKLFYFQDGKSKLISQFILIIPNENELKEEVKLIIQEQCKGKTESHKYYEIEQYIKQFYGKVHSQSLVNWVEKNNLIKL